MENIIFLTKASLPSIDEYIEEIRDIWDSHWVTTMGPKHELLIEELKKFLKVDNVSLFINGHNALELTIQALNLTGEVITTPFTFISTTHAIVRNGLKPVFCDINRFDLTIDTSKIESLITEKTSAIIPVHIYGNICNFIEIDRIAKKYGLKVIYDGAHAFGERINGKDIGNFGDATIYSFHASKVYNSIEGGCVTTQNKSLKSELDKLKNFGLKDGYSDYIGTNAKMHEFSAAMGLCNLRNFTNTVKKRKLLTKRYEEKLMNIKGIRILGKMHGLKSNYSYMPILVTSNEYEDIRNNLVTYLNSQGVQALKHLYPIVSNHPCYKDDYEASKTPIALEISKRIILLPLYEDLKISEVDYICNLIRERLK